MNKFFALLACSLALCVAGCGGAKKQSDSQRMPGSPNWEQMTPRSMIVAKPTLVRMGVEPIELDRARAYMMNIFHQMRPELDKTNITYQMAGHDIILMIQTHLILESNGEIRPNIKPFIENVAKILATNDRTFVEFKGFTSSKDASQAMNLAKSQSEAASVADFFMKFGIMPERVFIAGMGKFMWVADNSNREGQLLNNRIEIRISPLI
ncbi:MAG: OmpA family protein [Alphaproteobacteria bacterium]|nr:OmpA family protein [Alphaproteobacteria bacterium]